MEDAWFLSKILKEEKHPQVAFQRFERKRRKKVDQVVKTSWQIGQLTHIPFGQSLRNFLLRLAPKSLTEQKRLELYSIDY